ncbi:MAG: hypothetical protein K1Y36_30950 [Blastocatellia bacterium]|nr:hypothetical protein [Blastocatellia bacterium]
MRYSVVGIGLAEPFGSTCYGGVDAVHIPFPLDDIGNFKPRAKPWHDGLFSLTTLNGYGLKS